MKEKHSTFNIEHSTSIDRWLFVRATFGRSTLNVKCWMFFLCLSLCPVAFGAMNDATNTDNFISSPPVVQATARGFYNAGTGRLLAGKFDDAETLLESSLARQDEGVQPEALFNLGHVRFAQGNEELKKSPDGAATIRHGVASAAAGEEAVQKAADALASNDEQQMVAAYLAGRGARHEIRAATKAVQSAMEKYGKALVKWQRALNDFKSAAELNPADTNAVHNAEIVEQAIARLVDRLQEMQQLATKLGGKKSELDKMLKQLKGKIPAPDMPPGAPGGQEEDEDGDDGKLPSPESLAGRQEGDRGGGGQELGLRISAEQAGQLMNSLLPGAKQLPMGQGDLGGPKNPAGRIW
jgi:tetratricopeptide (TPR) repeat protein